MFIRTMRVMFPHSFASRRSGFTLVEMLVVLLIMALLATVTLGSLSYFRNQSFTKEIYDLKDVLTEAKTIARARNTFVWVGFGSGTSGGQSVLVAVAYESNDGTSNSAASNLSPALPRAFFPNLGLQAVSSLSGISGLSATTDGVDSDLSEVTSPICTLPDQSVGGNQVSISKVIQFDPDGESYTAASVPVSYIQLGLEPQIGARGDAREQAALQISGLTGEVQLLRN